MDVLDFFLDERFLCALAEFCEEEDWIAVFGRGWVVSLRVYVYYIWC